MDLPEDPGSDPKGFVQAYRDALEAYTKREHLLTDVLTSVPLIVFALDRNGVITLAEGSGITRMGLNPHEMVGVNGLEFFGSIPNSLGFFERVFAGETIHTIVPFGDWTFEAWYAPVLGKDGKVDALSGVALDITVRTRALIALRETELRLQMLFANSLDATFIADEAGNVLEANPVACRLLGYTREELVALSLSDFIPQLLGGNNQKRLIDIPHTGFQRHVQVSRRDGSVVDVQYYTVSDTRGLHLAVMREIGATSPDAILLRNEERFAAVFETVPVAATLTELETGRILAANDLFFDLTGYSKQDILHRDESEISLFVLPATRPELLEYILPTNSCRDIDVKIRTGTGGVLDVLFSAVLLEFGGKHCILAMFNDLTERRRMEQEILDITEKERRRIGQDLHDGLGSHLTGIAMLSRGLAYRVERGETILPDELDEIARLAVSGVEQARTLARGLNPIKLESKGLVPALEELARTAEARAAIPCIFSSSGKMPYLNIDQCTHLFRIAQEALNNAIRHARASRLALNVEGGGDWFRMTILDDGEGLSQYDGFSDGMGVRIMNHRASLIGADLHIGAAPEKGTLVRCALVVGKRGRHLVD